MNRQFSINPAATTLERSAGKSENSHIALWFSIFVVTLTPIAFGALISDASSTPEQRISLYLQSGNFP